jgi:YjbR protein
MTAAQFRRLALSLPDAIESSHCAHPDFRVRKKIFATLGYPDSRWGMVKLTPAQQTKVLRDAPDAFRPAAGAWGRSGSTIVLLSAMKAAILRPILQRAYETIAAAK